MGHSSCRIVEYYLNIPSNREAALRVLTQLSVAHSYYNILWDIHHVEYYFN